MVPVGNSLPILEDLVSFWATQQVVASFLRVLWVGDVWLLEVGFVGVLFVNTNHFTKQKQINCQKIQKLAVGCDAIQSLSFCNFCYLKRCETFACFSPFFKKNLRSQFSKKKFLNLTLWCGAVFLHRIPRRVETLFVWWPDAWLWSW